MIERIITFLLNLLFPPVCANCQKEGSYLCSDCFFLIEILTNQYCPFCSFPKIVLDGKTCPRCRKNKNLTGLFAAVSYQNFIIKKLISLFKYQPFIKELSKPLSGLIIQHFGLVGQQINFPQAVLTPVPLYKKRLKWRGFNQAEEIAKELALFLGVPLLANVLFRKKETRPQIELSGRERKENIKGVFLCRAPEKIRGKIVLLVDDVFTTGSTMEECALILKDSGAKEVWGVAAARE